MESQMLKIKEMATVLKISPALAYRMCLEGTIPSLRFGRSVRVRQIDLENFIIENLTSKDLSNSLLSEPSKERKV